MTKQGLKVVKKIKSPKGLKVVKSPFLFNTSKRGLKLERIIKSPITSKKYRAEFNDGTHADFGAKGYQNYGGVGNERHLDEERKKRYLQRHKSRENWSNPKSAGSLSRWILWNKTTLQDSIKDYKNRFNL